MLGVLRLLPMMGSCLVNSLHGCCPVVIPCGWVLLVRVQGQSQHKVGARLKLCGTNVAQCPDRWAPKWRQRPVLRVKGAGRLTGRMLWRMPQHCMMPRNKKKLSGARGVSHRCLWCSEWCSECGTGQAKSATLPPLSQYYESVTTIRHQQTDH